MLAKALFLDIDGVLNSAAFFAEKSNHQLGLCVLDPVPVARLHRVLKATSASIILSSTWRVVPGFVDMLRNEHRLPILSVTPCTPSNHRGREILAWLAEHPDVERFVIVDDDEDAGDGAELAPRFVRTDWRDGLQDHHVETLIRLLND